MVTVSLRHGDRWSRTVALVDFQPRPKPTKAGVAGDTSMRLKIDGKPLYTKFGGFLIAGGGLDSSEVSKVLGSLVVLRKSSLGVQLMENLRWQEDRGCSVDRMPRIRC